MKSPFASRLSWSLYDFANSAFTTVILTFVFATYFSKGIAPTEEIGARWWGWSLSASGLIIAILSPALGAIADHTGRRKPWLFFFTWVCVLATGLLWFVQPAGDGTISQTQMMILAIVLVGVANIGFELGTVFNNTMLPDVTESSNIGRWSGFAYGLGYLGGLLSLFMCLGFNLTSAGNLPYVPVVIAVWVALFSLPLLFFTPDRPRNSISYGDAIKTGLASLVETFRNVRQNANLFRFLVSHMFYRDGLNTLLQMGGLFAGAAYGLTFGELLKFGILLNVTAAFGAFVFAWADDKYGSKPVLIISVAGLILTSVPLLMASDKTVFYVVAATLGLFVGSIQSSSRTMIGRMADKDKVAETYGLFAFSGKSSAFLGPLMVGELTHLFGHRIGMASLIVFLVIGLALLLRVQVNQK